MDPIKKTLTVAAFVAALLGLGASGASAHPGHTGCRSFGQHNAAEGRAGVLDDEIRSFGAGNVDDVVRLVHLGGQFGLVTVPAFCEAS